MPDSLLEAGRKEAEALAKAQAADPGIQRSVQITVDRQMAEVKAGIEGQKGEATWAVAAYCRYYWDKTKDWCGGVIGTVKW